MARAALFLVVICCGMLLPVSGGLADTVYPSFFLEPVEYKSTDLGLVTLDFTDRWEPSSGLVFRLSRSYLTRATPYSRRFRNYLPDRVRSSDVDITMRFSTNEPATYAAAKNPSRSRQAQDLERFDTGYLKLKSRLPRPSGAKPVLATSRSAEGFEALLATSLGRGSSYVAFHDPEDRDLFESIECMNPSRAGQFCTYRFVFCPTVAVEARFVDFRYHGGTVFARNRIQQLRGLMKTWLPTCPTTAPVAANVDVDALRSQRRQEHETAARHLATRQGPPQLSRSLLDLGRLAADGFVAIAGTVSEAVSPSSRFASRARRVEIFFTVDGASIPHVAAAADAAAVRLGLEIGIRGRALNYSRVGAQVELINLDGESCFALLGRGPSPWDRVATVHALAHDLRWQFDSRVRFYRTDQCHRGFLGL